MSAGLNREELEVRFNEHLSVSFGKIQASQVGENPTLARELEKLGLSDSSVLSLFIGMVASAILDTIADNNNALN